VWVISFGILVKQVGNFLPLFIVLYLTGRGYSAGAAGLALGVSGLGKVLGNAIGGYLADKIGRRWTIVLSATTAGLTAMVPFLGPLAIIVAVVGPIGVTSQVYRPAAAAVLIDSVPATNQQRLAAFGVCRFAMTSWSTLPGACCSAWSWRCCCGMRPRRRPTGTMRTRRRT
jgi:MFS family permease